MRKHFAVWLDDEERALLMARAKAVGMSAGGLVRQWIRGEPPPLTDALRAGIREKLRTEHEELEPRRLEAGGRPGIPAARPTVPVGGPPASSRSDAAWVRNWEKNNPGKKWGAGT